MSLTVELVKLKTPNHKNIENGSYFSLTDDYGNYDDSKFANWAKRYKTEIDQEWLDTEKYKNDTGIDIINDYDLDDFNTIAENNHYVVELTKKSDGSILKVDINTFPKINKKISIVCSDTIAIISKPFNDAFYDDFWDNKTDEFIWTKEKLIEYFNKYCINDEKIRNSFKTKIIDKFVEGENAVFIGW